MAQKTRSIKGGGVATTLPQLSRASRLSKPSVITGLLASKADQLVRSIAEGFIARSATAAQFGVGALVLALPVYGPQIKCALRQQRPIR
jgi:hypothetical protein